MNILMLSDNYFPEMNANARIFSEIAELWAAQNQKVSVITCHPNFPKGKLFKGHKNTWVKKTLLNKVNLIRVKTYMHPNKGLIKRTFDFLSFGLVSFVVGLFQEKPDVIIGVTPQFFAALSACFLSLFKRKPFVMILCDLWPDSVLANGIIKKGFLYRIVKKIEVWMYHRATSIVILSEYFRGYLNRLNISDHKIITSISGASQHFYPRAKSKIVLDHYHITNKFIIGYIGTFGISHNHEDVLSVAEALKSTHKYIHFLMIGSGAKKDELIRQTVERGLDNVTIDGPFPSEIIPDYWSVVDLSIIPLAPTETNKTVLPSKILENMAMGIPALLYAPAGEAKRFLASSNAGWFINAGDIKSCKNLILEVSKGQGDFFDKKNKAVKFASRFTREQQAFDLLAYLETTCIKKAKKLINEKI